MGDDSIRRVARLTAIAAQLQEKRMLTAAQLSARFAVSIRTIYRDMATLVEAGIPVVTVEGKGYALMEGYRLPPVMFTEQEANALVTAGKLVETGADASLSNAYASAIGKVSAVLQHSLKEKLELLSGRIAVSPAFFREPSGSLLLLIQQALTAFEVLEINYHSAYRDERTERRVEPFALYYSLEESWLLIAYCRLRKDFRMFRLDRIVKVRPLGLRFPPHKMTLARYLAEKQENLRPLTSPCLNLFSILHPQHKEQG